MKSILSEIDLGKYLGQTATEFYNKSYSDRFKDYLDDIKERFLKKIYGEGFITYRYECYIELPSTKNLPPLIIKFYKDEFYNNDGELEDVKYYI